MLQHVTFVLMCCVLHWLVGWFNVPGSGYGGGRGYDNDFDNGTKYNF